MNRIIGLIVNPVAGMGGSVGLKGTDGEMYKRALEFGATPVTPKRTDEFLSHIKKKDCITLVVAPGKMGERYTSACDMPFKVIGAIGADTSREDTKSISKEMVNNGAELLIFVGGDGTARDIYDAIRSTIPVVAVPAGVKVFSSVFAVSARAAAEMVDAFVEGTEVTEEEVLDIDEKAFREGRLASRLYGYMLVPRAMKLLQRAKEASNIGKSSAACKQEIARYIVEEMDKGILYLLGPGTTLKAVADELGVPKTLLGIDAVFDGNLVGTDLNEKGILELFDTYEKRKMLLTPIGGNGFILGRGSKQFTPEVIKQVNRENIMVVGTSDKINRLECLRVDTGDFKLDQLLSGFMPVTVGYKEEMMIEVRC
ncbi:MAG: ATP-NAD kinase family protein [Desulfobacteraceae bacterium]|nr:ATP-NAD kinase family protein [Desulfobacteraceae bacterium]